MNTFKNYFEAQMNLNLGEPTPTPKEFQKRQGLYTTIIDAKESLDTIRDMFGEEVDRLVSKMNQATGVASPDTPFHQIVIKTKDYIVKMKEQLVNQVEKLEWSLTKEMAEHGASLSRKNPKGVGFEDWETASRVQLSKF